MANTSSAKKAQRGSVRKYVFNARRKKAMKDAVKELGKLITKKSAKDAVAALPELYQTIDKAAKNGTIKKNTAARMKSRLTKRAAALAK
ncbi:30S ribosomal protein S20 [Candidatus Kaiserbacteria bacterium RIFCSPHIGHO2_02_FULL_55_25]|uniref:Small ribosomal subunit protein bS20 n=1 Tax=Candidatus Kaiserbacteria bacterium RIFCSPHIGHO2_02_FULL_55_25 TaxID=1798498 RepID=A0A1F6E7G8_9BACT|nr:MAG: 30S ribosomal protein S20 [Candidatus Kaiserbacteria bacterium RIFCSPHIGHO2_02_FULL_55_25]OGG77206.1 MAG: 30S ribosomal protein S20 [Candidatus Kaiserbacteria bacterium RIFCSPHIGHO2_12_FULL_55_13]OGG83311.1 MAG: 30S ribosomal protein S20 [Candidatus Kaiserbacteria bacterium RIFCSPLOWO2_01_FULL_55_25]